MALGKAEALRIQPHFGLAACRARQDRPLDAWKAAEAGLARGLLDDLAAAATLPADSRSDLGTRLDALDRALVPLLVAKNLDEQGRRKREDLLQERARLDEEAARAAADASRRAVLPLQAIQDRLTDDSALVLWIDASRWQEHWGCVVRRWGLPAWVRLEGSGPGGAWTEGDDKLPHLLRNDLARGEPDFARRARRLAAQRLGPLAPYLAATGDRPAVRRLVVVPVGVMAGVPVEVLSDRYRVSYAPSGSVLARLRDRHRPLGSPTLLALGDPAFALPDTSPPPEPPDHGLYLAAVLPGGNGARHGMRGGDVLLRYAGANLTIKADLKIPDDGTEEVPVAVWREGRTLESQTVAPGKLDVIISNDPPALALRKAREREGLADARVRDGLPALPGTRLEVAAIAAILPPERSTLLLGSKASEQELDALAGAGKLKEFRLLHLATHGTIDPASPMHSFLSLARDRLPGPAEQASGAAAGQKVYTGRLSVADVAKWELDADLVTLSACQTALGPQGDPGEGLLGFSQVLLGRGARSLVLSLWKVDDTATALLMARFYQNLLGQREELDRPLPKAEALHEAKRWLRTLPRAEVEKLVERLAGGVARGGPGVPEGKGTMLPAGDTPFANPFYWAAFILLGDPE
jgi:CHAT domain-containing protein